MGDAFRLDAAKILEILPHRQPWVLVDRVTTLVPGQYIIGRKMISLNEPWAQGHFPGRPVVPQTLLLEALMQAGALLVYSTEHFDPATNLMYYLGFDKVKFKHTVTPGDRVDLRVEILEQRTNTWLLRGEGTVEGTVCAQAEMAASIVDRD
jgi:3-hydroxyacyl-[acyl-carrier-protein] dehydratase